MKTAYIDALDREREITSHDELVIPFWEGECGLKIQAVKTGNEVVRAYECNPYGAEFGGTEYELILLRQPQSNIIRYDFDSWGLKFCYQPKLTHSEVAGGVRRPSHIVGSYAVYHASKSGHLLGEKNYKVGKACHIYRPWVQDASGWRMWCEMRIKCGTLLIQVPPHFLRSALYPVIIDPLFGYDHQGASADTWNSAALNWVKSAAGDTAPATPASNGTLTKLSLYGKINSGSPIFQPAIYSDTGSPTTRLASSESGALFGSSNAWIDSSLSYGSIVAGTQYWLGYKTNVGVLSIQFDTASGGNLRRIDGPMTWPDPAGSAGGDSERVSIYATYTAAGSGVNPAILNQNQRGNMQPQMRGGFGN